LYNHDTAAYFTAAVQTICADYEFSEVTDDDASLLLVTCFVQSRAAAEMLKKVNVLSDMWKNGKISYPVKSTMARLATG